MISVLGASSIDLDDAATFMGIVLNVQVKRYGGLWRSRHLIVIRKINGVWYYLDRDLVVPQLFKDEDEVRGFLDQNLSLGREVLLVNNNAQIPDQKPSGTKRFNANAKPVTSGKQSIKGPYGKNPGCTTNCGLRLPRKTECTAAGLIKHVSSYFVKGLRLVVMRKKKKKKKRSPPLKKASSSAKSAFLDDREDSFYWKGEQPCQQESLYPNFLKMGKDYTESRSLFCRTSKEKKEGLLGNELEIQHRSC